MVDLEFYKQPASVGCEDSQEHDEYNTRNDTTVRIQD
jgi:hypothetical protein